MLPKKCPACGHKSLIYDEDKAQCTDCDIYTKPLHFWQKPLEWATGRGWWWRLPIIIWFVVMLFQNWHDPMFAIARTSNPFSAFDLGIHELGHLLFSPFGVFMHILGGSLFQCLFPIMGIAGFWQIRWYFASMMCLPWLGLNLFDVATYAADAQARVLPLTTGFAGLSEAGNDETYDRAHDWYQILSRTHHLDWDLAIAHILRVAAATVIILGLTLGTLLLIQMAISSWTGRKKVA
jgi:hypothetical protein